MTRRRLGPGRFRAPLALALLPLLLAQAAFAVQPDEVLRDPALEARARAISAEVRCLVCQNQTIDDSDAPLARDLRLLVRERLTSGDTDGAVKTFIVDRYGDFVLLRPPLVGRTLVLWFGPLGVLAAAALGIAWSMRRRAAPAGDPASLTGDEEARLAAVLGTVPRSRDAG